MTEQAPAFEIRLVALAERPALAPLFRDLLLHYGEAPPDEAAMQSALAAQPAGVEILVAFAARGAEPVGLASFAQLFPGPDGAPQIYMKELYVTAAARGGGVGELLMIALARLAAARGAVRVDWTTARTNLGARAFYDRIGAKVVEEKVYYRLEAAGIAALAARGAPRR